MFQQYTDDIFLQDLLKPITDYHKAMLIVAKYENLPHRNRIDIIHKIKEDFSKELVNISIIFTEDSNETNDDTTWVINDIAIETIEKAAKIVNLEIDEFIELAILSSLDVDFVEKAS